MSAPKYVPTPTASEPRVYSSPPRRNDSWMTDRPAEIAGRQPEGDRLGSPGPDQGYALLLAARLKDRLVLTSKESADDALSGCTALAMKRSALFGRGPVIHDITSALTLWGFLGDAPAGLAELRSEIFAAVAHTHHYFERRAIVDAVPDEVLRLGPDAMREFVRTQPEQVLAIALAALAAQSHAHD